MLQPSAPQRGIRLPVNAPPTVRAHIAWATKAAHEALHVHPVLGRLLAKDLDEAEYRKILLRHLVFYQAAEEMQRRFASMAQGSFAPELGALRQDVGAVEPSQTVRLPINSGLEALGMSYVLHGARFGAKTINLNLKKVLPMQGHWFFSQRIDKLRWHSLLLRLEQYAGCDAEIAEITFGAEKTFQEFDRCMREKIRD